MPYRSKTRQLEYQRQNYRKNRKKICKQVARRRNGYRQIKREYVNEFLAKHPCSKCGEKDIVVLDFHHVIRPKVDTVSKMVRSSYSVEAVIAEIQKCIVVCANCHRRIHNQKSADSARRGGALSGPGARVAPTHRKRVK